MQLTQKVLLTLSTVCLSISSTWVKASEEKLWDVIKTQSNLVLIVRHAEVSGRNPTQFDPSGKCQGESMLTPKGRQDAMAIGLTFRSNGVDVASLEVVSSAMCRTRDTAIIAFGKANLDPDLREFFSGSPDQMNQAMNAAENWVKRLRGKHPLILITHLPNIDALTGEQPNYNQMVVTQSDDSGQLEVIGKVRLY
jgi:phosphohistidine phosphatase SixA